MTLIASVVTHDYAVQVSDRRVTRLKPFEVVNDLTPNTTVALGGSVVVGYSGLAVLGNPIEATHRVITEIFSKAHAAPAGQLISWLASQIEERMNATPAPPEVKQLALSGVGFARDSKSVRRPVYFSISNCLDKQGAWLPQPRPHFSGTVVSLPTTSTHRLAHIGATLDRDVRRKLERDVNRAVARSKGPSAIVRLLIQLIRGVADQNRGVGKSLLVSSLPRARVPIPAVMMPIGVPDFNEPTFLFIPADKHDGVYYGPNVAMDGIAMTDSVFTGDPSKNINDLIP